MAEKTKILDINIESIIKKSSDLKKELDDLRKSQAEMKKNNDTSSESYVKLEARIKNLSSEYNLNQKQLTNLVKAGGDFLTVNQKIEASLNQEINSISEARKNVAELTRLRNELNLNDKEQLKIAEELNKKIDQNNAFIKDNVSQLEKQKIGIGDYASGIKEAIADTGLWSGELAQVKQVFESFSSPLQTMKEDVNEAFQNIRNLKSDTEGLTGAQKAQAVATNVGTNAFKIMRVAIAALGIGLIISLILLLIGYLRTFDPLMDKLEQGFSAVGAVIEVVAKGLLDFVTGLTDVGNTMKKVGSFFANPIKSIREFGNEMKQAAKDAIDLKKAQQDLEDQVLLQEIANKKATQQVKELMLQSRNLALTEEERIAILDKAKKIEEDNFKQRADIAEQELDLARRVITTKAGITTEDIRRLEEEGTAYAIALKDRLNVSDEEVQAIKDAEIAKIQILEESTQIREKIQNQTDALDEKRKAEEERRIKEIQEARQKALDNALSLSQAELNLFISNQGIKAKSLEEEIALAEKVRDKKLEIAQKEFNASKKTNADRLKLLTDQNNINNEFLQKQVDAAIANANQELNAFVEANKSKIDAQKFFTDVMLQEEIRRLELISQKQYEYEKLRFEQGVINEQQYQEAVKGIQDEFLQKKDEAQLLREEAQREKQAIDLENQRAYEDLVFQENLEIALQRLELQRQQEVANAERTGANIELINRKYAALQQKLERETSVAKIESTRMAISDIGFLVEGFFGENKLLSAALASTDMFLAIQKAYLSQLIPGDPTSIVRAQLAGLKAGAFGALNVSRILGVSFADGGIPEDFMNGAILKGPSHAHGGIMTPYGEMEGKEAIINKRSTEMFKPLLSAINVAGGGRSFARGGIPNTMGVTSVLRTFENTKPETIDYDLMASKIADANRQLPPNKLILEEFNASNDSYNEIITGANF